ncbi:MAG TPA: signal peptidase I [Firmicutes bacterium]|nr:signal peptidase I [Bacillota bacterium]
MNKKGNMTDFFHRLNDFTKTAKSTYLYKITSKFLSTACTIILVLLLIVGAFMFYFNMKAKSFENKGQEYTSPFGLYTIISGSMEPNVSVYDVVVSINEDISKIKVGDIITFISTWDFNYGVTVTHRVVDITKNSSGEYQLTTKGDNNQSKDGGIVTQNNLVGKVVGRLPQLGRLQYFLATKMGWFLIVFIPALAIIIFDIIKIFKLYVLKDQIEKVKTRKEALANALKEEPENNPKEELVYPTIDNGVEASLFETAAIDLPIVDTDGKLKEPTLELPVIKGTRKAENNDFETEAVDVKDYTSEISILTEPTLELSLEDGNKDQVQVAVKTQDTTNLSLPKKAEDIPTIVKPAQNRPTELKKPIQRRMIKRR